MKSKSLENLLARETGMHSDMVTRFQALRKSSLLSRSRGKNAEDLSHDEVVSGILSMVSVRPGYAALAAKVIRDLKPVGLPEDAFARAPSLGEALLRALEDPSVRATISQITLSDADYPEGSNYASIRYTVDASERVSHYVHRTAQTLFHKGKELDFDRFSMGFAAVRELAISRRLLNKIASEITRHETRAKQDEILARKLLQLTAV